MYSPFMVTPYALSPNTAFRKLIPIQFTCTLPRVQHTFTKFDSNQSAISNYSATEPSSELIEQMKASRQMIVSYPIEMSVIRGHRTI